jgi:trafficking protein particle complex subunit 8
VESQSPITVPRSRSKRSPLSSEARLPYRRSNASLSQLFASTTSLPGSPSDSGTVTPTAGAVNGSLFSPTGSTIARSPSPTVSGASSVEARDLILRAFSPHVSVLASRDTEELVRHKGINGGLLELLRPFGERVQGKVTVRDSSGVSRSWEDFGVRFIGVKDGLENPRGQSRRSTDSAGSRNGQRSSMLEYKPARLRSGGDVAQIEEVVERHLTFAEEHSGPVEADYINQIRAQDTDPHAPSPFYTLYLRRLLSGMPMVPSETFSHPVASVIAISSRCPSPIEELRNLFTSSNQGEHRLPQWVHNEFLRYYVLVHDEDYDDITKSTNLFDQMKRHFGLHCHLLRLRSTQCVPSDDGAIKLPHCEWMSAAEELAEIVRRETSEEDEDPTPCVFETDAAAIRAFVREMITQSVVPSMERASATWNDQVASRRRGLSGRFMSLSKRFTTFGGRTSSGPSLGAGSSNYDSLQGFYRPDAPEAIMRKLADYAMMLRDYKLAQSTYEILCQDYKSDKAWRYYAGANEMAAASSLLSINALSSKVRVEAIDQYLETAYYSYMTRVGVPYNGLRTLILGIELLKVRGGSALDDAARWSNRILDDKIVGPIGHVLIMERVAACFTERKGVRGLSIGDRRRKAAFWNTLATDAWLRMEKTGQAEKCLTEALRLYRFEQGEVRFEGIASFLSALQHATKANRNGPQHFDGVDLLGDEQTLVEPLQEPPNQHQHLGSRSPVLAGRGHRKSLSTAQPPAVQTAFDDPLGAVPSAYEEGLSATTPLSPRPPAEVLVPTSPGSGFKERERRDDGFE